MTTSFSPPSPGAWELEQTHLTRPPSRLTTEVFPPNMMRGFADGTRAYGLLLDHLETAVINGFVYMAPRPVGAPKSAKGHPPRPVFWLLQRLHPEVRRRIRRADVVFRTHYWREELQWWDADVKPQIGRDAEALLSEDVDRMNDAELAAYVRRAVGFVSRTVYFHHRFNAAVMVPLGDFLVHTIAWTGMAAEEILQVMRGLSPVSAGATEELTALRAAILSDAQAMIVLQSNRTPAEILTALGERPEPVSGSLQQWIKVVGLRVLGGYDVADPHAREHPDMLVKVIRAAVTQDERARRAAAEQAVARVRERVPSADRDTFDDLLREAQLMYRLRDERIFHGDGLGAGVCRHAVLAAGARLAARGRIHDAEHLFDAGLEEIAAILEGRGGPSSEELAQRADWRKTTSLSSAPARLGFEPSPPPPADWLPPAAARLQRVTELVLRLLFEPRAGTPSSSRQLKGFGVSPGVFEGPARVVTSIADLPAVQAGEVLVATATGPSFNVALPLIGAIVTERGGALSHPAIVAREYGLPGVVGCPGATTQIKTGMRVRVDGASGDVWALDPQ